MSAVKRKREEQKMSGKRMKIGQRISKPNWESIDLEEVQGQILEIQQPSSMQDDLEAEKVKELDEEDKQKHEPEAKRTERGEVHLRDLKDECPIKPVKNHDSRYAE
jgi:uncharacterized protein YPO0396